MERNHRLTGPPRLAGATAGRVVARLRASDEHAVGELARLTALRALVGVDPAPFDGLAAIADRLTIALAATADESTYEEVVSLRPSPQAAATTAARRHLLAPTHPSPTGSPDGRHDDVPGVAPDRREVVVPSVATASGRATVGEPSDVHWTGVLAAAARLAAASRARPITTSETDIVTRSVARLRAAAAQPSGPSRSSSDVGASSRSRDQSLVAATWADATVPSVAGRPAAATSPPVPAATVRPTVSSSRDAHRSTDSTDRVRSLADLAARHVVDAPSRTSVDGARERADARHSDRPLATADGRDRATRPLAAPGDDEPDGTTWTPGAAFDPGDQLRLAQTLAVLVGDATADDARRAGIDLEQVYS